MTDKGKGDCHNSMGKGVSSYVLQERGGECETFNIEWGGVFPAKSNQRNFTG